MTAAAAIRAGNPFGWRFTGPLLLGSALNPINSSMIATALIGVGADFHRGPAQTASLISVLYLCSAVAQPTMGKLATIFGSRRVFLAGAAILLLGGIVGAAAPDYGFLLVSRALIGIGTSAAYPTAMALVRRRADGLDIGVPGRVLGNFSVAAQVSVVVGLPLGGVLAGVFGWRAIFLVNVPLALVTLICTYFGVAEDDPIAGERRSGLLAALDVPGIAVFAGAVVALLMFLSDVADPNWWEAAVAVVLGAALVAWERRLRAAAHLRLRRVDLLLEPDRLGLRARGHRRGIPRPRVRGGRDRHRHAAGHARGPQAAGHRRLKPAAVDPG